MDACFIKMKQGESKKCLTRYHSDMPQACTALERQNTMMKKEVLKQRSKGMKRWLTYRSERSSTKKDEEDRRSKGRSDVKQSKEKRWQ